jgi:agmatinase
MLSTEHAQVLQSCLCPPGEGVFTVNTARERKEHLHQALYGACDDVLQAWQAHMNQFPENGTVMLGVCSDNGGGILRGANWGPLYLRDALLAHYPDQLPFDLGDVRIIPHLLHDKYVNSKTLAKCRQALYGDANSILPVSPLSLTEFVCQTLYQQASPPCLFGIGGDHSVSYPLVKTYLRHKQQQGIKVALIHFDAHTDLLKERMGIDLCFGSWCTHILSDLPDPALAIQIGIRSSARDQLYWEKTMGVTQHWAASIHEQGMTAIAAQVLAQLEAAEVQEVYVSFDIDALDVQYASATGTPEKDGLTPTQCIELIEAIATQVAITGADIMELAPLTDSTLQGKKSHETTLAVSADIAATLLRCMP